jgi:type VI secretion system secreted protein VgrG
LASVVRYSETREIGEEFRPPTGSPARKTVVKNGDDNLDVDSCSQLITAKMSIELKCGDSKITMTPVSVTIESPTISVKSKVLLEEKSDGFMTMNAALIKIN